MVSREVVCPECGRPVPSADINVTALVAKCSDCSLIFDLEHSVPALAPATEPARPAGITMDSGLGGELLLKRRWFHPMLFFLLFFCIAWDAFLVFWYAIALFGPGNNGGMGWLMIVFPVAHVAVGVGLTYYVVAGFLNKTEILVTADSLYVRHRPIPWRGNRELRRDEIRQIEIESAGISTAPANPGMVQLSVCVHHTDGSLLPLLSNLPHRDANYVAWHLAEALGVPLLHKDQLSNSEPPSLASGLRRFLSARDR